MKKWQDVNSKVIVLEIDNIDTDMIIPAQYLTSISRTGYSQGLFKRLRDENPNFPLNQIAQNERKILIAGANFGCGSSREHAVWALLDYGIDVVMAKSFGDIFYANSLKNGLLPITLSEDTYGIVLQAENEVFVSLQNQSVSILDTHSFQFEIDSFRKDCILQGLDDLDYILAHKNEIQKYREARIESTYINTRLIGK